MSDETREADLVDVFTTLADTLVADYDVIGLLQTLVDSCARLFDIEAAGILLADDDGRLEVVASTSEASRLIEVFQIDADEGPCLDCYKTGEVVVVPDIAAGREDWRHFRDSAKDQGFQSVHAIPLTLRDTTIGALNLLRAETGALNERDSKVARALADVATISILHERNLQQSTIVQNQLQRALNSRVIIEQAKGVLAYSRKISPEDAFAELRARARNSNELLTVAAQRIVDDAGRR